jgi:uncharacterized protein (DUF2235 family)
MHVSLNMFRRDTVSSIGIVRGRNLPLTDSCDHICYFRHALALDERRVKFLPECILSLQCNLGRHGEIATEQDDGDSLELNIEINQECKTKQPPNVKEVWFAGSHSDVYVFFSNPRESD